MRRLKHISCIILTLVLITGLALPAGLAWQENMKPGQTVTGTFYDQYAHTYVLRLEDMPTSEYISLELNLRSSDGKPFEARIYEFTYDGVDEYGELNGEAVISSDSGGVASFKTAVGKYVRSEYSWSFSLVEDYWADRPDLQISYGFTLNNGSEPSRFSDVLPGDWYYDAVEFVTDRNLFQGTGPDSFSPGMPMTRGMFATVLGRRAGIVQSEYSGVSFGDVPQNEYYSPYVKWASSIGIISGDGNQNFAPNNNIIRQDIVTILYRYVVAGGGDTSTGGQGSINSFTDSGDVAEYARTAMSWAVGNGIINGTNGKLRPYSNATRAEVAQILINADNYLDYR